MRHATHATLSAAAAILRRVPAVQRVVLQAVLQEAVLERQAVLQAVLEVVLWRRSRNDGRGGEAGRGGDGRPLKQARR